MFLRNADKNLQVYKASQLRISQAMNNNGLWKELKESKTVLVFRIKLFADLLATYVT
jgi:hypothetical protein